MTDAVVTNPEQVAGFAAAKHDIDQAVSAMFRGYIHDDMLQRVVFDVLLAGAKARAVHPDPHTLKIVTQPNVPMKTRDGFR